MTQLPDASNGLKLLTAKGGRGANGVFSTGGFDHLTTSTLLETNLQCLRNAL